MKRLQAYLKGTLIIAAVFGSAVAMGQDSTKIKGTEDKNPARSHDMMYTYIDLNTGDTLDYWYDSDKKVIMNRTTNVPVDFYINTNTGDTVYGRGRFVVNGLLLLKPIEFDRFLVAVNKVKSARKAEDTHEVKDFIFLNVQKKKVKILFSDIVYIESQREYIRIVTTKAEYLSKMGTHEIEALLPAHQFKRVHRSFIVSVNKIESYTAETIDVHGTSIPIGRGYKDVIDNL